VVREYAACVQVIALMRDALAPVQRPYTDTAARAVLLYNRTHRSGKYASKDDKKLYIRSARQFAKALAAGNMLNDYMNHDFIGCETCKNHGVQPYMDIISSILEEQERKAERQREAAAKAARAKEQAAIDAAEKVKLDRWKVYNWSRSTPEQKEKLKIIRQFDLSKLIEEYRSGEQVFGRSQAVNACVRWFADKGEPFTRQDWDARLADAHEAFTTFHKQSKAAFAAGDQL
jgi:hypothetical protein